MENTSADELIIDTVASLCKAEIGKYQNDNFYNVVPRPLFDSFAAIGLTGLNIPEEYGGSNATPKTVAQVLETIAKYDLGPAIFLSVHGMVSGLISRFGNSSQRSHWLPKLASGKALAAFALTEPGAGSDASAIATEARQDGNDFILDGSKCYITSAGFAELYLVFARTTVGTTPGISAFLVPADVSGLTVGKPEKKMGCELSPIASVFFDQVRVPQSGLLGEINGGYRIALGGLAGGRINIAACAVGISEAAIKAALQYMEQRQQFDQPIIEFQGLQFMLADMYCKLEAARALTYNAADDLTWELSGTPRKSTRLTSSVAKCFATDAAMEITTDAVQLLGGAGYIKEYPVERFMRDAKMLQIVEGTNQIQRMVIARELRKGSS